MGNVTARPYRAAAQCLSSAVSNPEEVADAQAARTPLSAVGPLPPSLDWNPSQLQDGQSPRIAHQSAMETRHYYLQSKEASEIQVDLHPR